MNSSWLKLNLSEMEVMLVSRGNYFEEFAALMQSSLVEGTHPQFSSVSIVVHLSSLLMLSSLKTASLSNAFHHLLLARRLHPIMVDDDEALVIHASGISWLNYSIAVCLSMKP